MNISDRLDKLYARPPLRWTLTRPAVVFSDCHMGGGGKADNFGPNRMLFRETLARYNREGWQVVLAGDISELWQFDQEEIRREYRPHFALINSMTEENRLFQLSGNHDLELKHPEALLISWGEEEQILVVHGHQGDWINDGGWKIGRWFTRYVWKPLECLGVGDPTSASKSLKRHELVRLGMVEWAASREVPLVAGHTHSQENEGYYWNAGSCIQPGRVECVEIEKEIKLKTWTWTQ